MASETILLVNGNAVSLKLTRILLVNEGYKVITAAGTDEAFDLLRSLTPDLVLADLGPKAFDGLELARRLKSDEKMRGVLVMATAEPGEADKAIAAGCDAFVAKPVDGRSLASRIRAQLDTRPASGSGKSAASKNANAELQSLRVRFLAEGRDKSRELLMLLDGAFNPKDAAHSVHQWVGTGGLLGYTAISRLAREAENILGEQPLDATELRESLTNLALAFSSPREAREAPLPDSIVKALTENGSRALSFR